MEQYRMNELAIEIDEMMQDILLPARAEKIANENAFMKLDLVLKEMKQTIDSKDMVSCKLIGRLFFLYSSLISEAQFCKYDSDLFRRVAQFESDLMEIFKYD